VVQPVVDPCCTDGPEGIGTSRPGPFFFEGQPLGSFAPPIQLPSDARIGVHGFAIRCAGAGSKDYLPPRLAGSGQDVREADEG
jgi:hypothetical protein